MRTRGGGLDPESRPQVRDFGFSRRDGRRHLLSRCTRWGLVGSRREGLSTCAPPAARSSPQRDDLTEMSPGCRAQMQMSLIVMYRLVISARPRPAASRVWSGLWCAAIPTQERLPRPRPTKTPPTGTRRCNVLSGIVGFGRCKLAKATDSERRAQTEQVSRV